MEGLPSLNDLIKWSKPKRPSIKEGLGIIRRYYRQNSQRRPSNTDAMDIFYSLYEEDDLENISGIGFLPITLELIKEAWIFSPRNFVSKTFRFIFKVPMIPDQKAKKSLRIPLTSGDQRQVIKIQVLAFHFQTFHCNFLEHNYCTKKLMTKTNYPLSFHRFVPTTFAVKFT